MSGAHKPHGTNCDGCLMLKIIAERDAAWHIGVLDGRHSAMLRMEPKSPYDGQFYDRDLAMQARKALTEPSA